MAHGTPDYGVTAGAQGTHPLFDVGELAVRLGTPSIMDRRGDVVHVDGFEDATGRYDPITVGTGAAVARSQDRSHHGAWCYKLTGGSDAGGYAGLEIDVPAIQRNIVGFELHFNRPDPVQLFHMGIYDFDGVNYRQFEVRWVDGVNRLEYTDAAGNPIVFATGIDYDTGLSNWHYFKLVADLVKTEYVRAIVDDVSYDLRAIPGLVGADARSRRCNFFPRVYSRGGFNDVGYIDDLGITENEPA